MILLKETEYKQTIKAERMRLTRLGQSVLDIRCTRFGTPTNRHADFDGDIKWRFILRHIQPVMNHPVSLVT